MFTGLCKKAGVPSTADVQTHEGRMPARVTKLQKGCPVTSCIWCVVGCILVTTVGLKMQLWTPDCPSCREEHRTCCGQTSGRKGFPCATSKPPDQMSGEVHSVKSHICYLASLLHITCCVQLPILSSADKDCQVSPATRSTCTCSRWTLRKNSCWSSVARGSCRDRPQTWLCRWSSGTVSSC